MRQLLAIAILLVTVSARAATGDITSVTIDTNGWNCFVVFSGMGTNSPTFNNGMGGLMIDGPQVFTNTVTGLETFKLFVSSSGFDATGAAVTNTRPIYGTKMVRKAYPNNALPDTDGTGGNAKVNIALSEGIAAGDTVSWSMAANAYSQGGIGNNGGSGSCVNNSILSYPKTFGNWAWYGWNAETNSTMHLEVFAYEQHAHDGKPVACVKIQVTNTLGESYTATSQRMTLSRGWYGTELLPVGVYQFDVPLSGFTQGTKLICNGWAYPWEGDATSLASTTNHLMPSGNWATITNICNKTFGYGTVCAVVSATTGTNASGLCATNGDPTSISPNHYFATIDAALNQAMGSNGTYFSHTDVGNVNIYCTAGAYTWMATARAYGARPDVYPTVQPYPGLTASDVSISNNAANSSSQPTMVRFKSITYNPSSVAGNQLSTSNNNWGVWIFDSSILAAPHTAQVSAGSASQSYSLVYVVDCAVRQWGQGFTCQGSGAKDTYPLLRGCDLTGFTNIIMNGFRLGNYITATNAGPNFVQFTTDKSGQGAEIIDPVIDYNNAWMCLQLQTSVTLFAKNFNVTNGLFVGNDIFEFTTNCAPSARFDMGTANGLNDTNVCIVDSAFLGAPFQVKYNDDTTSPSWGIWYQLMNCFIDNFDIKSDTFTGGASGANGLRIGNWWPLYGCGFKCNVMNETTGLISIGSFLPEFGGLNLAGVNIDNGNTGGGRTDILGARVSFVRRRAYDGTVYTGNGDYRLGNGSLVHRVKRLVVALPFDIYGNQRGDMSPVGPFSESDLNK